jgi:hypothetical protein
MKILKCPNCGVLHPVKNLDAGCTCNCHNKPFRVDAKENLVGIMSADWVRTARAYAERFGENLSDVFSKILAMQEEAKTMMDAERLKARMQRRKLRLKLTQDKRDVLT